LILDYIFDILGIILAFLRLMEPFVMQEFLRNVRKFLHWVACRRVKRKGLTLNYSKEPLCSFVNSAMNVEYVSVILLGITNLMENRKRINEAAGKTS